MDCAGYIFRSICKKTGKECSEKVCHSNENDSLLDDFVQINNVIILNFGKKKYFKVYDENDVFDILDKYGANSYMFVDGNTGKGKLLTGIQ